MKNSNPFQIPSCFQQQAELERRRRERFRKSVVISLAGAAAMLVVMLIEGCMSEHASVKGPAAAATEPASIPASQPAVAEPKPVSPLPASPVVVATVPAAPAKIAPMDSSRAELMYVVKPGDTLSGIAKHHQTTVKTLKSVNGLESDMIVVGDTLKLPSA